MKKSAAQLTADLETVRAFRGALDDFIAAHHTVDDSIMGTRFWITNDGQAEDIPQLRRRLSELAGTATRATRGKFLINTVTGFQFNPITNWSTAFTEDGPLHGLTVQAVCDFADSCVGELESLKTSAEERERLLAASRELPSSEEIQSTSFDPSTNSRELARFLPASLKRTQESSPLWVQIGIGVVASLIAAGIVAAIVGAF
jgi:hypothetical protein